VPAGGVLVVEGVFAQRPELADAWDLVVYVDTPDDVRMSRRADRDGVPDDAGHPDQSRYLDAQRIYCEGCRPIETADVVVDNRDPERPRIVRIPPAVASVAHNGQS
jgi:uridine kinase